MSSWIWLDIPLMTVVFIATVGIPLSMVLRRPDETPEDSRRRFARKSRPSAPRPSAPTPLFEREPQLTGSTRPPR